jgi:hypothetical protein
MLLVIAFEDDLRGLYIPRDGDAETYLESHSIVVLERCLEAFDALEPIEDWPFRFART